MTKQSAASQSSEGQPNKQNNNGTNIVTANNNSVQNSNEITTPTKDSSAENNSDNKKQETKPDLSTFPGLSLFFTATPNNINSDTPVQNINTANRDQANAVGKTPAPSMPTTPMSDEQMALSKAAASLQTAIAQGTAYINSAAFSKMTAEKQAQLRAAMQNGKELMAKYNAMQTATNSAALDVDQNNKNKAATNVSTNLTALNAVTTNNTAIPDTNSAITTGELAQAAHNIMLRLGAVNSNISYDASTQTVTISEGEINNQWISIIPNGAQVKHINITGRVTVANGDASSLFGNYGLLSPLQDITGLNNLDTNNVTNMSSMFSYDSSLTSLDVSNFNTSNVTDMSNMFSNDSSLTGLDVSNFNTSNVTDMNNMFSFDSGLTSLNVSNFDTSKVTGMKWMFSGDYGLTSLDLSNFDTSKVTDMSSMFSDDRGLTSLDASNFDTKNVTNMSNMFYGDSGLTSLDISNFDTSNASSLDGMLAAANLNKLTLGEKTKLASGVGIPGTTWYKDGDLSKSATVADLENGKAHAGTWELANASVTLEMVNAKHTYNVLYTSDAIPGFTGKSLDLTDSTVKATYITPNIPTGYAYATTDAEFRISWADATN